MLFKKKIFTRLIVFKSIYILSTFTYDCNYLTLNGITTKTVLKIDMNERVVKL